MLCATFSSHIHIIMSDNDFTVPNFKIEIKEEEKENTSPNQSSATPTDADKFITEAKSKSTKASYNRYVKMYVACGNKVHSEDTVLQFLTDCRVCSAHLHFFFTLFQEKKKYLATTLWSIQSHLRSYLMHELRVDIGKCPRMQHYLKKLSGIFSHFVLFCVFLCVFLTAFINSTQEKSPRYSKRAHFQVLALSSQ